MAAPMIAAVRSGEVRYAALAAISWGWMVVAGIDERILTAESAEKGRGGPRDGDLFPIWAHGTAHISDRERHCRSDQHPPRPGNVGSEPEIEFDTKSE